MKEGRIVFFIGQQASPKSRDALRQVNMTLRSPTLLQALDETPTPGARADTFHMEPDVQNRLDPATPDSGPTAHLSPDEKRALELTDEVEHSQGVSREAKAQKADDLAGDGRA